MSVQATQFWMDMDTHMPGIIRQPHLQKALERHFPLQEILIDFPSPTSLTIIQNTPQLFPHNRPPTMFIQSQSIHQIPYMVLQHDMVGTIL